MVFRKEDSARMWGESQDNRFSVLFTRQFGDAIQNGTVSHMHAIEGSNGYDWIFYVLKSRKIAVYLHDLFLERRRNRELFGFFVYDVKSFARFIAQFLGGNHIH